MYVLIAVVAVVVVLLAVGLLFDRRSRALRGSTHRDGVSGGELHRKAGFANRERLSQYDAGDELTRDDRTDP